MAYRNARRFTSIFHSKIKNSIWFSHLPPFLHPQIALHLETEPSMKFTSQALREGFPLFVNPMVDIEHVGNQIEASILLTIPVVPNLNGFGLY